MRRGDRGVLSVLLKTNYVEDVGIARVADAGRFSWLEVVESSQYRRHFWSIDQGVLRVLRISEQLNAMRMPVLPDAFRRWRSFQCGRR